jgi:putative phosphoribosyl transferase
VVLAGPCAPPSACGALAADADEVICLETPGHFLAIGEWYRDFSQTSDHEVVSLLRRAAWEGASAPAGEGAPALAGEGAPAGEGGPTASDAHPPASVGASSPAPGPAVTARDGEVVITTGPVQLAGHLSTPGTGAGIVVFAHGSGSSRHSPRNRFVADVLADAGLGTLLFDLLTAEEEQDRDNVFDIRLLARRLGAATWWLRGQPGLAADRIGYFGASTGAAAALLAAAELDGEVAAVVSRGGRPDLAIPRLAEVRAPTLLIVGALDDMVLRMNREAQKYLRCENHLAVVPGASHVFEEPGTLEQAASLARDWFTRYLAPAHAQA